MAYIETTSIDYISDLTEVLEALGVDYLVIKTVDGVRRVSITNLKKTLVPYSGAVGNVDLGAHTLTTDGINLDTVTPPSGAIVGQIRWNADEETSETVMPNGVVGQHNMELLVGVINQTGASIPDGTLVRMVGTVGASGKIKIAKAVADDSYQSDQQYKARYIIGCVTETIDNGETGKVTMSGKIRGIDTTGTAVGEVWADGDVLWANPAIEGALTNVKPESPNLKVPVAVVVHAHSNGTIALKLYAGNELEDLHNVHNGAKVDGCILEWDNTLGYWKPSERLNVLEGDVTTAGSVLKSIKDNAENATYDNSLSGLSADTLKEALDEIAGNVGNLAGVGRTTETVKDNADAIEDIKGTGWTDENLVDHEARIGDMETNKADKTVVDNNRLYSDSQYLELKAKADALQVKCNTLQAEVYTDDPILQYGAVEIIGKGYEADDTPIDVSANVVDGSLDLEQKGLTITNGIVNGRYADATTGLTPSGTSLSATNNIITAVSTSGGNPSMMLQEIKLPVSIGEKIFINARMRTTVGLAISQLWCVFDGTTGGTNQTVLMQASPVINTWYTASAIITVPADFAGEPVLKFYIAGVSLSAGDAFQVDGTFGTRAYNLTALGLASITDTAILAKLLPYVEGTKNVPKLGLQILDADDAVTQTIFLPAIGNSMPNGTADSIKTVADGWEHTKRVQEYVLQESDIIVYDSTYTNVDILGIKKNADYVGNNQTWAGLKKNWTINNSWIEKYYTFADRDNAAHIGFFTGAWSLTGVYVVLTKGTYADLTAARTALAGTVIRYELATPITTHYDLPLPTSGKTVHRFAGEEKIALYGTGLTFDENVLSVLSAVKFVAGVMTDITSLATITDDTVTFSGVNATDVVFVMVEHDVDRPLGVLEHTPTVSNTASRLEELEGAFEIITDAGVQYIQFN